MHARKTLPDFCSCNMSYVPADAGLHFGMQITFCVAVKEARIARNGCHLLLLSFEHCVVMQ